jgi:hypothetical protein
MVQRRRIIAAGAAAMLLAAAACTPSAHHGLELRPAKGEGLLHAVHDTRLRAVMQGFNSLMFEQMMTELELDEARLRQSQRIADSAGELAKAAAGLPSIAKELNLTSDEQALFLKRSVELRDKAIHLQEAALGMDANAMRHWLLRMEITCNNCHRLFRGPRASPLQP